MVSRTTAKAGGPPLRVGRRGCAAAGGLIPRASTTKTKRTVSEDEIGDDTQQRAEMLKMRHQRPSGSKNSCVAGLPCGGKCMRNLDSYSGDEARMPNRATRALRT